jgi:tripartite ATP-independent transporter DctM subunit
MVTVVLLSKKLVTDQSFEEAREFALAAAAGTSSGGGAHAAVDTVEVREAEATPRRGFYVTRDELWSVLAIGGIAVCVLGGIYGGVFTETEAGAVGALFALVLLVLRARHFEAGVWATLGNALKETAANTAMLVALLIGGGVFTLFLVTTRVPQDLTLWITGLDVNRYVIVVIILLVMLVLGALLDGMSILLLTIPMTYPIVTGLGFDGLWYGILAVKMIEIGLLTPPFGLNAFMISSVVKEAKVESVFRGLVPFVLADIAVVAILVIFPDLVTWLPSLMRD